MKISKRSWAAAIPPDHHTTSFHLPLQEDMVTMSPYLEQKKPAVQGIRGRKTFPSSIPIKRAHHHKIKKSATTNWLKVATKKQRVLLEVCRLIWNGWIYEGGVWVSQVSQVYPGIKGWCLWSLHQTVGFIGLSQWQTLKLKDSLLFWMWKALLNIKNILMKL